jgi:hypothetical protein
VFIVFMKEKTMQEVAGNYGEGCWDGLASPSVNDLLSGYRCCHCGLTIPAFCITVRQSTRTIAFMYDSVQ